MASYNRVILMGNLTRDIELRYLPSGTAVAEFSIAVNERKKTSDGQWVDEAHFFDIVLYQRSAEVASEYLSKGSPVLIEGRLRHERWEKDGQKNSRVRVVGDRMQMIGSKQAGPSQGTVREGSGSPAPNYVNSNQSSRPTAAPASHDAQPTGSGPGYDEPEIPF